MTERFKVRDYPKNYWRTKRVVDSGLFQKGGGFTLIERVPSKDLEVVV